MPLPDVPQAPNLDAQHLPYLDGWRGVAILLVLAAHFNDWPVGGVGVTIFFALSGVLMTRILFVQRTPLKVFYLRRAARILPAFWLYVLVVFVTWKLVFDRFDGLELLTTLTFLRTYVPDESILHSTFPIGPIWSLNVEEHSYVLLSLLSIPAARRGSPFAASCLFALAGLCVLCFLHYKSHPPQSQSLIHLRTEVAALPLLLSGAIYLLKRKRGFRATPAVSVFCAVGAVALPFLTTSVFVQVVGVGVLASVAVNTLDTAPPWFTRGLSAAPLRWLGTISFSLYLWQQLFYFLSRYFHHPAYPALCYIGSIMVAAGSYYGFERPIRSWLTRAPSASRPGAA